MPNRIIKESICTSEEIDSLDGDIESFFYRLIVNADDFGLLDARPKLLASKCYPLKSIDIKCILTRLEKLVSVGLIYIYTVDNKPFISILSWEKHQQIRAKKPKFPRPENGIAINCNQLISIDTSCARTESNPIQSNPIAKKNIKEKVDPFLQDKTNRTFEEFWNQYPRKAAKPAAQKAWKKIKPEIVPDLMQALLVQSAMWVSRNDKEFIPYPATWLNGKRWEDELPECAPSNLFAGFK